MEYSNLLLDLPRCITRHLDALKGICHFSDHSVRQSKSACRCSLSFSSLTRVNTLVSSANFNSELNRSESESFMDIKNSNGPRTDPCGTPLVTEIQLEQRPFIQTLCFLTLSHSFIHNQSYQTLPPIPCLLTLSRSLSCGTREWTIIGSVSYRNRYWVYSIESYWLL